MSKRCSSVTVSLIPFLSIDIQLVSLVIHALFSITTISLTHCSPSLQITRSFYVKDGCEIGKTKCFLLSGTVL